MYRQGVITMELFLHHLDDHTDMATKQMLQQLINKKRKFNRYKFTHFLLLSAAALYSLVVFYVVYHLIDQLYLSSVFDLFTFIISKNHLLFVMFIAACLFGSVKIFFERKEKAEKEFHDLRCEIIEKSKDLWKDESWTNRHRVFELLKEKYDINLYHESK